MTAKRLWSARGYSGNPANNFFGMNTANVDVDYTHDTSHNNGQITQVQDQLSGETTVYTYDSMGRPSSLTDASGATGWGWGWPSSSPLNLAQNTQYDYAGRMTSLQYMIAPNYVYPNYVPAWTQQTMSYNVNGQLTSLGWATNPYGYGFGTPSTISYSYSTSQNNGQITQVQDQLSGETIVYTYDSLKRLTQAAATPTVGTSPAAWTQNYQFDGFGNLTSKNGVANSIPVVAATNRLSSASYDLNGNMTSGSGATMVYDEANRISSAAATGGGIEYYGYSADSKRFYKYTSVGTEQLTFFGARGEKLGVYSLASTGSSISPVSTNIWFAGKAIVESNEPAYMDRLGTNRGGYFSGSFGGTGTRFYPYGEEITSTTNDHEKFATYTRDDYTKLDYADQRYYASTYGRFNTADPYQASGGPASPASWNRYSYTSGDPVNRFDPEGLRSVAPCTGWSDGLYGDDDEDYGCLSDSLLTSGPNGDGCSAIYTFQDVSTMNCWGTFAGSPVFTFAQANPVGTLIAQAVLENRLQAPVELGGQGTAPDAIRSPVAAGVIQRRKSNHSTIKY